MDRAAPIKGILASLRVRRWAKNVVFFAALLFAQKVLDPGPLLASLIGFALLCLASGGLYLANDLFDLEKDRSHPDKRSRPLVSGRLPVSAGVAASAFLLAVSLAGSFALRPAFGAWMLGLVALGLAYSAFLQRLPIVDLFGQSFLFLIRIVAGAVLIDVPISRWLLLCGLLLSLFLALSRQRHELTSGRAPKEQTSPHYSPYLIDQMIAVVTSATLVAYTLYTFSPVTEEKVGSGNLVFTIPFVLYGIFRYLYVIYQKDTTGTPEREIFLDRPLMIDLALYLAVVALVLYLPG